MEPHGLVLQKHKDTIIKAIVQSQQTVGIIYELSRRNVFEESVVEALMGGETTETNRARHLISQLQQGSSEAFNSFVSVLKQLGLQEEGDILLSLYDKERNGGDVIDNQSRVMPSIRSEVGNGAIGGENGAQFNNNLEEPFIIRVIPSTDIVTEERDNRDVYKNSSMPRGLVFLANYKFFKDNEHPIRNGSEKDVQNLSILFNQMGYKIPHQHHNLTSLETHRRLQEFAELPELASVDSCIIVIMSHGRDEESFYAHDNQVVKNQDVINYFNNRNCSNLRGKPKIFIFQHCRGKMQDFGVQSHLEKVTNLSYGLPVEVDGASQGLLRFSREPTYTDLFLIYSTVGGYVSFRHPDRGSWLIEAICLVFMSNAYKLDLDALMKKVSQEVRKNYADGGEKQICEYVSRGFDRHFFFNPVPLNENLYGNTS